MTSTTNENVNAPLTLRKSFKERERFIVKEIKRGHTWMIKREKKGQKRVTETVM
jgi:hypothetical protein